MDAITPVGAMIKPPPQQNPIQTLSGILGLKQQQLALQTGQQQLASQTAQATVSQQTARENQAGAQLLSDPVGNGILDKNGNPTPDAENIILRAMPTTGPDHYSAIVSAAQKKLEFNASVNKLRSTERAEIGQTIAGAAADPHSSLQSVEAQLQALVESKKGTPEYQNYQTIAGTTLQMMEHQSQAQGARGQIIPNGQEAWRNVALQTGRTLLGASGLVGPEGLATPKRGNIDLGGKQVQGTFAPVLAGGGFTPATQAPNTLAPTIAINPVTHAPGAVGGPYGTPPAPFASGPPGAAPGSGSGAASTWTPYPGEQADIKNFQTEVGQVRQAADQAPLQHNINQEILRLSADARTGPGTAIWQHAVGALAAPLGLSPNAPYQEVGKFLEKNAIANMQAMGGPASDARLSAAAAANGSTSFNPAALQMVTKFNDATNSALMAYRRGMDNVVGTRNPDYTKLPDFRKEWAKNFDVNVFLAENAYQTHDTAELEQLRKQLGPNGFKELAPKYKRLMELEQGKL